MGYIEQRVSGEVVEIMEVAFAETWKAAATRIKPSPTNLRAQNRRGVHGHSILHVPGARDGSRLLICGRRH
jgi:hypothetical protein